ncbi:hypothetical protein NPIL_578101 [Nephila pilipes]|uniref:Uncharacterized protein n=1 Tax=Nephila pilipes TaxID=299642 RepID=A0A8X6TWC3_NEPPI|nr:hypothetical protein NPIL_578101 [Nephila pilipes]
MRTDARKSDPSEKRSPVNHGYDLLSGRLTSVIVSSFLAFMGRRHDNEDAVRFSADLPSFVFFVLRDFPKTHSGEILKRNDHKHF